MKYHLFSFIITLFVFFFVFPINLSAQTTDTERIENIMNEINKKRQEAGLKKLVIDNNLCDLAQKLAEDSEKNYPDEFIGALNTSPSYKNYLEDYATYKSNQLTISDVLVEKVGANKSMLAFTDEHLVTRFTNTNDPIDTTAMSSELEYGCLGISSGEVGYKPFAYFIGGVKKEPEVKNQFGFFQVLIERILAFFK